MKKTSLGLFLLWIVFCSGNNPNAVSSNCLANRSDLSLKSGQAWTFDRKKTKVIHRFKKPVSEVKPIVVSPNHSWNGFLPIALFDSSAAQSYWNLFHINFRNGKLTQLANHSAKPHEVIFLSKGEFIVVSDLENGWKEADFFSKKFKKLNSFSSAGTLRFEPLENGNCQIEYLNGTEQKKRILSRKGRFVKKNGKEILWDIPIKERLKVSAEPKYNKIQLLQNRFFKYKVILENNWISIEKKRKEDQRISEMSQRVRNSFQRKQKKVSKTFKMKREIHSVILKEHPYRSDIAFLIVSFLKNRDAAELYKIYLNGDQITLTKMIDIDEKRNFNLFFLKNRGFVTIEGGSLFNGVIHRDASIGKIYNANFEKVGPTLLSHEHESIEIYPLTHGGFVVVAKLQNLNGDLFQYKLGCFDEKGNPIKDKFKYELKPTVYTLNNGDFLVIEYEDNYEQTLELACEIKQYNHKMKYVKNHGFYDDEEYPGIGFFPLDNGFAFYYEDCTEKEIVVKKEIVPSSPKSKKSPIKIKFKFSGSQLILSAQIKKQKSYLERKFKKTARINISL